MVAAAPSAIASTAETRYSFLKNHSKQKLEERKNEDPCNFYTKCIKIQKLVSLSPMP